MTREETAAEFAKAMGWLWCPSTYPTQPDAFNMLPQRTPCRLPRPDAPLHEHLAFVGRMAEACAVACVTVEFIPLWDGEKTAQPAWIGFGRVSPPHMKHGSTDLSWSAMLAAIEAKKAT